MYWIENMQWLTVGYVWDFIPAFLFTIGLVPTHPPAQYGLGLIILSHGSQSMPLDQLVPSVHGALLPCPLYTLVWFERILAAYLFTLLLVWGKIHLLWWKTRAPGRCDQSKCIPVYLPTDIHIFFVTQRYSTSCRNWNVVVLSIYNWKWQSSPKIV
jgi:hypothetical protein